MREGYDGRRGGIASGSARGMLRFDQLVAADNRDDAKRLGLLNDDELNSDDEEANGGKTDGPDIEEDEAAMLDRMLKDRFLNKDEHTLEEDFSDEESEDEVDQEGKPVWRSPLHMNKIKSVISIKRKQRQVMRRRRSESKTVSPRDLPSEPE